MTGIGWVRVELTTGHTRVVMARTFGQAAAKVRCGPGEILWFEVAAPPKPAPPLPVIGLAMDHGQRTPA